MSDAYNGVRFEVLRHIHGLTQRDLGERVGIAQSKLSRIERGDSVLSADLASRASVEFGEPLSFFQVRSDELPIGPIAFRKKASTPASERNRVSALFLEASRVFAHISAESNYRTLFAVEGLTGDPARLAENIRAALSIGVTDSVRNVTRALERLGVGVVSRLDDERWRSGRPDASGFSMPTVKSTRPLVATVAIDRGDVQRITLAHELGHLVLDRGAAQIHCSPRSPQERAAFEFASAFLLPVGVLRQKVRESSTLRDLLVVKAEYGISVGAIIMHAKRNGILSEQRARTLQIQLSSRGWRENEPVDVVRERPVLFAQALNQVFPTSTYARASHVLGVTPDRLRRWAEDVSGDATLAKVTALRR
ncbi:ImmA/IrrE family metallo-endopeptidase [Clavibacter sp. CT19]|uniref:XRE family transcriptional regulator n=1 Tax=Clavibacter sp. CT19 TaxID=3018990 RepID=UPI003FA45749